MTSRLARRILLMAATAIAPPLAAAEHPPQRVQVPAHVVWCVASQPLDPAQAAEPGFGDLVFNALYQQLEGAALARDLTSFGVPYAASATPQAPPPQSPPGPAPASASAPPPPPPPYVVKVCAAVPPGSPAPAAETGARVTAEPSPQREVFAVRCEPRYEDDCKTQIVEAMKAAGFQSASPEALDWIIRQGLSAQDDATALAQDLSDSSLRPLRPGAPPVTPEAAMVVAAAPPE